MYIQELNDPKLSLMRMVKKTPLVTGEEKILVLGAKGQVAQFLVPELQKYYGENLILADLEADPNKNIVAIDVTCEADLRKYIHAGSNVKVVINLAALLSGASEAHPALARKVNVEAPKKIVELAKGSGVRKVFTPSSIAVLGQEARKMADDQRIEINRSASNGKGDMGPRGFGAPIDAPITSSGVYGLAKGEIEAASRKINQHYKSPDDLLGLCLRYGGVLTCQPNPSDGTTEAGFDKLIVEAAKHRANNDGKKRVHHATIPVDSTFPMLDGRTVATETMRFLHADPEKIKSNAHCYGLAEYSASIGDVVKILKRLAPGFEVKFGEQPYNAKKVAFANSWPKQLDVSDSVKDWSFQQHYTLEESVRHHFDRLVQYFKDEKKGELGLKPSEGFGVGIL